MANYIAVIHKDPKSDFGVSFPDFPGCITAGRTIDEAKDLAQEALGLHIKGLIEDGERIPAASKLEDLVVHPECSDAVAFVVISVPEAKAKVVRVNVTIPEDTLELIDTAAKRRGMSRSSFLVQAAERVIRPPRSGKPLKDRHPSG
ncbi:MAG: type II toxin-antitoxin system HicB family antitoxin [Thermodesulfobacteriota bacterium]